MEIHNGWQGKLFSVLGDSISTYEDIHPVGYAVYYQHERRLLNGLTSCKDCWWQQVIDAFGGKLLANSSYSGAYVVKSPYYPDSLASALHPHRIESLSKQGREPDVIMVYLGTNDLGYGTMKAQENDPLTGFPAAYDTLLCRLKARYPHAELWCFTLCPSNRTGSSLEDFRRYNAVIADCADRHGGRTVDLFDPNGAYSARDGVHPDRDGMKQLAQRAIKMLGLGSV